MTATGQGNQKNRSKTVSTEERDGSRRKGILFILMAAFFFSLMSVFVRLSGDVPTMQKAFFRNIVAAFVAVVILLRSGQRVSLKKENLPPLLLRSIFGTIGILANFWAVDNLGIADANMLNKLSPFFAILMSIFILGEKPNRIEWLSVLLAFIGAAFVAKPSAGIISLRDHLSAGPGRDPGRLYGRYSLYLRAQGGASGGERSHCRGLLFDLLHACPSSQPAAELYAYECPAADFPDPGRMQRRRRTAVCHGSLSACTGQGYFRVRLLPGRLCGSFRNCALRGVSGCLERDRLRDHYRNCFCQVVSADTAVMIFGNRLSEPVFQSRSFSNRLSGPGYYEKFFRGDLSGPG